ncbi:MAG: hypothetical protein Fur009_4260 [Candidatus Microgenomates bacterium]
MIIKKIIILFLLAFLILFFKKNLTSAQSNKILINEFLIDLQPQQVEIINIGSESANLKNWLIDDDGGSSSTYQITDDAIIYPNSCLVFSSNFYLNTKSSDTIRLFDDKNNLIDSYFYKSNPGANISYQRLPDAEFTWATAEATIGAFNQTKTPCLMLPTTTPSPTPNPTPTISPTTQIADSSSTPTPIPTQTLISYDNIFISEAMVYPQAGEKEWVELFNNNDFSVDLVNWYVDDIENAGSSLKLFSLTIPAKSYKAITLSTSMFNNEADNIRLLDFNKNLKDSFEYFSSQQNKTWGRIDFENDDFCLQEPSFEQKNNPCINPIVANKTSNQLTNIQKTITNIKPSITQKIKKSTVNNIRKNPDFININTKSYQENGQILGISTSFKNKTKNFILLLNINAFFYSFLTVIFILIKINLKYGKIKKLLLSLIYTE